MNGLIVICAVTSVTFMPLGDAMTLIFTSPLSTMIVASIFLGHRMRLYKIFNALLLISGTPISKGPFRYYVIKEVDGWGQKFLIFYDLQYCKSSKRWLGGPKKVKNKMK